MAHSLNRATGAALMSPRSTAQQAGPSLQELVSGKHPLSTGQAVAAVGAVLLLVLVLIGVAFGVQARQRDNDAAANGARMAQEQSLTQDPSGTDASASIAEQIEEAKRDPSLSEEVRANTVEHLNERQMTLDRKAQAASR